MPASAAMSSIEAQGPMRRIARSAASSSSTRRSSRSRRGPRGRPGRAGRSDPGRDDGLRLVTGRTLLVAVAGGGYDGQQLLSVGLELGRPDAGTGGQLTGGGGAALGDAHEVAVAEHDEGGDLVGAAALAAPGLEGGRQLGRLGARRLGHRSPAGPPAAAAAPPAAVLAAPGGPRPFPPL